ncbi:MAG: class II fructose-bisphosphate aldolase [Anaerolineales bacterium]
MLTILTDILLQATEGQYGVIAPDFTNLFTAKTMLETAQSLNAPLILSYSVSFKPMMDVGEYEDFIAIVKKEIARVRVPVCLHLDHATNLEDIREAVELGFSSVMIDGSTLSFEDNVELTRQAVEIARPAGVAVEAELGQVTTGEGYFRNGPREEMHTDPQQARPFVEQTGIDALAVAIGNIHGAYIGKPVIDLRRLKDIARQVDIPLVLHGTSGIGDQNLRETIQAGIRKINLYSELIKNQYTRIRDVLQKTLTDPVAVVRAEREGIQTVLETYIQLSGSKGQGDYD